MNGLRPISTEGFDRPASIDPGVTLEMTWLHIADLVVDDSYQRRISREGQKSVRAIAAEFRWPWFTPVLVAPVDGGKYAIIDGQHRTTAAAICGFKAVPCLITKGDRREQAKAFAAINGRVQRASAMQIYHAAKAAGAEWAVGVDQVVSAAGVEILRYPIAANLPERPRHSTMSAKAIQQIITRFGPDTTITMLRCISGTPLGDDPAILGHIWMRAIATCLSEHPGWSESAWIEFFSRIDAGEIYGAARANAGHGISLSQSLAIRLGALVDAEVAAS